MRALSQVHENESTTEEPNDRGYLWGTLPRRAYKDYVSSPGHDTVLSSAIPMMRATLLTGHDSQGCKPWADNGQKGLFNRLMAYQWDDLAKRVGQRKGYRDPGVDRVPTQEEAKKVRFVMVRTWILC